jgi:hypothetical protein
MYTNPTLLTLFADARYIEAHSPRRWTGLPLRRLALHRRSAARPVATRVAAR